MKKRIFFFYICCILFGSSKIFAQAHDSHVYLKNEKCPAVSIKLDIPFDVSKVVLSEDLKHHGLKGKNVDKCRIYENVVFSKITNENITLYTIVEPDSEAKESKSIISFLIKKSNNVNFITSSTDSQIIEKTKKYLNEFEAAAERTFLEIQITNQTKLLDKLEKKKIDLKNDSVLYYNKIKEVDVQLKENSKELQTQRLFLDQLYSKKEKKKK